MIWFYLLTQFWSDKNQIVFQDEGSHISTDIIRSFCVAALHNKRRKNDDGNWRIRFQVMTHVGRACLVHCIFHVHMTYNGLCCVMLLLTVIVAIDLCIWYYDELIAEAWMYGEYVCACMCFSYCADVCQFFVSVAIIFCMTHTLVYRKGLE